MGQDTAAAMSKRYELQHLSGEAFWTVCKPRLDQEIPLTFR
jgi:hypothetical protein